MAKEKFDVYKLKKVIAEIAKEYTGTLSFSDIFHARLTNLNPLTFTRDDDIELKESFLVVPKYRKFTNAEIGNYFVFQSNHEGQVHYYMYEASSPQGSNGKDYHWEGYLENAELKGTCSSGHEVIVTHGEIGDCKHSHGINKG